MHARATIVITSPPARVRKMSVCLSVCPLGYLKNHMSELLDFVLRMLTVNDSANEFNAKILTGLVNIGIDNISE